MCVWSNAINRKQCALLQDAAHFPAFPVGVRKSSTRDTVDKITGAQYEPEHQTQGVNRRRCIEPSRRMQKIRTQSNNRISFPHTHRHTYLCLVRIVCAVLAIRWQGHLRLQRTNGQTIVIVRRPARYNLHDGAAVYVWCFSKTGQQRWQLLHSLGVPFPLLHH